MKEHLKPEVGDVWVNKYDENKYYVYAVFYYDDELEFGSVEMINEYLDVRKEGSFYMQDFTYLGKSTAKIEQLFEVEDEE